MRFDLIRAFWTFLRDNKRWWLVPAIVMVVVLVALLLLSEGPAIAPFLYRR